MIKLFIVTKQFQIHLFIEEFEDTEGIIRIRISKKDRQHNGQKKKVQRDKQRSTKHTHKTKDRVTVTSLKTGVNSCAQVVPAHYMKYLHLITITGPTRLTVDYYSPRVSYATSQCFGTDIVCKIYLLLKSTVP